MIFKDYFKIFVSISEESDSLLLFLQVFLACSKLSSESCRPVSRMNWLLEFMGLIKNISSGVVPMNGLDPQPAKVSIFFEIEYDSDEIH